MCPVVNRRSPNLTHFVYKSDNIKMTDKNTSTVKSYADSAVAAGQSLLGTITGNPVDKVSSNNLSSQDLSSFF